MISIIQTCRPNDIEPRTYSAYYFRICMASKEMDAGKAGKLLPHKISGRLEEKLGLKKPKSVPRPLFRTYSHSWENRLKYVVQ